MTTYTVQSESDDLLRAAEEPETTPFDYIVVGSGAGGGPLAARLALEGRRVLVIEAGVDPATGEALGQPGAAPTEPDAMREVYAVPGYHCASTEDERMSWEFSVRHYEDDSRQQVDQKYNEDKDPSAKNKSDRKGGIFYPRTAALGGCTAHHAMIMARPNDEDWDRIAGATRDESWRSENMQGYFAKLEECLYYKAYRDFFGWIRWLLVRLDPRRQLEPGGHGDAGWQKTSFIHPLLVLWIVKTDWNFLRILLGVVRSAFADKAERRRILRALLHLEIAQLLDPNVRSPDFPTRASRLSFIPLGTDGVARRGVREHLLDVAGKHPDRLVLKTGLHATRVIFERGKGDDPPRAVGVEVAEGLHLYRASPLSKPSAEPDRAQYFARREVILCGGAFNTPQILMLSGIGDAKQLAKLDIKGPRDRVGNPVADRIDLPGVGANLQDRYEIGVISETKKDFSVLEDASLLPGDRKDPVRQKWLRNKTGLYTTNGGAVAMMLSSEANRRVRREPDLFVFGAPAAFRGYYWGWSKELLRATKGAETEQRNLWTWLILKAYTHNNHGTVRLRSDDPFAPPEIIFHSFKDGSGNADDIAALCEGVRMVREINNRISAIANEIQPDIGKCKDGSKELADWVQSEAWGHHACGTCRIGRESWRADVTELADRDAVLDSKFRVHGVHGLRVVDASVFPQIPGYFIVSSVFMVSEKAADTLIADSQVYPRALEREEAVALQARRAAAGREQVIDQAPTRLPQDAVGLALSGGGIRSATFCLGVLQALARCKRLGDIDFLSTVSGGGCAGGFLGRLFTRLKEDMDEKVERIQEILANTASPEIWWLRKNADYIAGAGHADLETNLAVVARNLAAVHLLVGALMFGVFGGLRSFADAYLASLPTWTLWEIRVSPWWWVPAVVLFGAVALGSGYWLTPRKGRRYAIVPLLLWAALLASGVYGLAVPGAVPWSAALIAALLLGWVAEEVTHWKVDRSRRAGETAFAVADTDAAPDSVPSTLVRNRLTRALGAALVALVASALWVVVDSLARAAALDAKLITGWLMLGSAPVVFLLRLAAVAKLQADPGEQAERWYEWGRKVIVAGLGFALAAILVFFVDVLAHLAFDANTSFGAWAAVTAIVGSVLVGRWFRFLNLSSLQQSYGQKLVRTFLGAANDARVHPSGVNDPLPVETPSADDDVFFDEYHPERNGGPLHLINVCVNETVAADSGRRLRNDKGLPMCVGPAGLSVGRRYHALWKPRRGLPVDKSMVRPLPVAPDPNAFHVLARADRKDPKVERLRLGQWIAISAAAVATGAGRYTSVSQSLLLGLLNIRLGYWWDSRIRYGKRPGRYPPNLWRRLKSWPASFLPMQATLLNEWRGYFPGPAQRLWNVSDGGHFENSGLYELVRRRLAFIIAIDGSEDPQYRLEDLAILTRRVRLDFGAEIRWLEPTDPRGQGGSSWVWFDRALGSRVPEPVRSFINPDALGTLSDLKRDGPYCGALARVVYDDDPTRESWLLLLKANLAPQLPIDVRNYAAQHEAFPNESTANQFFKDDQWESYRALGQCAGAWVFRAPEEGVPDKMSKGLTAKVSAARALAPRAEMTKAPVSEAVSVKTVSGWDTLRVLWHVCWPPFRQGLVVASRSPAWLRSGSEPARRAIPFLRKLRAKYGVDQLWTWFPAWSWLPLRRTLLVLAPETIEAVLESDANAADPLLKTRAVSRFAPESLVISSGDKWRVRRRFNEGVLDTGSERPHRHCHAFTDIVGDETGRLLGNDPRELTWTDFERLGAGISQRVILGIDESRPEMTLQLARLLRCGNFLFRHRRAYADFYETINRDLGNSAARCLVADTAASLKKGGATETTQVQSQMGFWLYVLKDAVELHVARTLALIAVHPEVQEEVRREVRKPEALTPGAIDSLAYLEGCLLEQMRLWTPVPMLLRRALKPFFLRDAIPIEAEQQILIHAGFYHRDERIFGERADKFSPRPAPRWGPAGDTPPLYVFSAHRQECAGRPLVTFVLKATLASLLRRFSFKLVDATIAPDAIPYDYDHFSVRLRAICNE